MMELHDSNLIKLRINDKVIFHSAGVSYEGVLKETDKKYCINPVVDIADPIVITDKTIMDLSVKKLFDCRNYSPRDLYKMKIYAVDFDETLYFSKSYEFPYVSIEENRWNMRLLNRVRELQNDSRNKFILWTCRTKTELDIAVTALSRFNVYFDAHNDNLPEVKFAFKDNPRKIYANAYIDDRNTSVL